MRGCVGCHQRSHMEARRGNPYAATRRRLHQRVAFRTHPVQDESVEQPRLGDQHDDQSGALPSRQHALAQLRAFGFVTWVRRLVRTTWRTEQTPSPYVQALPFAPAATFNVSLGFPSPAPFLTPTLRNAPSMTPA